MPLATSLESHEEKSRYLKDLFDRTYIKDVLERHEIKNDTEVLDILLDVLASGIGSLTNPSKLANTFKSERQIGIGSETIEKYIGYFEESFLIEKAVRYDVKGRKYIRTPAKYYYTDMGLRNARLGFRQLEETHIMENVLYNDLIRRGMNVDVGVVEYNTKDADGKKIRKQLEVDFVVNQGGKDKIAINSEIQKALSKAGFSNDIINYVASTVVKNLGMKNGKQQIYRTVIAKYGQNKGLTIYNHIKKYI